MIRWMFTLVFAGLVAEAMGTAAICCSVLYVVWLWRIDWEAAC